MKNEFDFDKEMKNIEDPMPPKELKKKKKTYKVLLASKTWVIYEDNGGGVWIPNIWGNIKVGDEILV